MDKKDSYIELVKKAQLGDKDCLNRLAETVRLRLYTYIHRFTLKDDLTQDILQESLLEMFKFLNKLEKTDRFWQIRWNSRCLQHAIGIWKKDWTL